MLEPVYPLTTPRLTLRPYAAGDLAFLHDMFRRDEVTRYLPWGSMDRDAARAKLEQRIGQTRITAEHSGIVVAAVETSTGQLVGEFMLRLISAESRQGEVGWSLHPDVHGRGLATEAAAEMLRLGFEELGLHRIAAECDPRNLASMRVMERLGMRHEGHLVDNELLKGEWVGTIICAILEGEWRDARRHPTRS